MLLKSRRLREVVMILGDVALVLGIHLLLLALRLGYPIPTRNLGDFLLVAPYIVVITIGLLAANRAYRDLHRPVVDTIISCIVSLLLASVVSTALLFMFRASSVPRSVIVVAAMTLSVTIPLWRLVFIRLEKNLYRDRRVIVVAESMGFAQEVAEFLPQLSNNTQASTVKMFLERHQSDCKSSRSDVVFLCPDLGHAERAAIAEQCIAEGVSFYLVPNLYEVILRNTAKTRIDDYAVYTFDSLTIPLEQRVVKRAVDLVVSLTLLLLLFPFICLIAIAIKVLSPQGSVFFYQTRVGKGGEEFTLVKFRTMIPNAESETGPVLAQTADPRVTPVGRVLRATRLDELPQLINVLRGEMSLIGPRPERPEFVKEFVTEIPYYRLRLSAKPGITGLAQVMGRYSTDPRDKLRYDLMYIAGHSFLEDLKIAILTVRTVVFPQLITEETPDWLRPLESWVCAHLKAQDEAAAASSESSDGR